MTGIYCYHNTINGKRYIGQAVDLVRRKRDHYNRAFNNFESNTEYNSAIHQAFRKYGYENFEYSILEECDVSELNSREIYWIAFYDSKNNGYNCDNGGSEKHFCKLNQDILDSIYRDLTETSLTFDEIRLKNDVSIGFVSDFNSGKLWKQDGFEYPLRKNITKEHKCSACGAKLYEKSATGLCLPCYYISSRKVTRPNREELKQMIRTLTFTEIGRTYGVSDNAVKKWCDVYNLPRKKSDIKKYTDTEWQSV